MKQLKLHFLWHMHQPYYRDDLGGEIVMPWVFLHAIKDYYDMPWYVSQVPGVRVTFNLVPSLLVQLRDYEDFEVRDKLLTALRKQVGDLSPKERTYLAEHLFYANVEHMIKPLPRFWQLYEKKCNLGSAEGFDDAEFLDLEVLYLLAWCGVYLRRNHSLIKVLLEKGRGYTHAEKIMLLKALAEFVGGIIPFYKKLMEEGVIEVSTTPFNHPITPLLLDIQNGAIANPDTPIPQVEGDLGGDAIEQIDRAIDYYCAVFGRKPIGFWPAEGAVSGEFLKLLADRGVAWAASDEEILYKSLGAWDKAAIYRRNALVWEDGGEMALFFRDHALSDLIGFTYSSWESERAVEDFVARLKEIHAGGSEARQVSVILDGENAWEYYPDNAYGFFMQLYRRVTQLEWCSMQTMGEGMRDETIPKQQLHTIAPGSWIGGNFNIWIGHAEKNRAWELIYRTRSDYEREKARLDSATQRRILKEFLIAESSDWFWWYGDDHHTDEMATFDALFRKHLINVYRLMQQSPPEDLFVPIAGEERAAKRRFLTPPVSEITPVIDGRIDSFFEWLGAGVLDLGAELSSMNMEDFYIQKVRFGWDGAYGYFLFEGDIAGLLDRAQILMQADDAEYLLSVEGDFRCEPKDICYQGGEVFELRVPRELVYDKAVRFSLIIEGKVAQQIPLYSRITFAKWDHIADYWFV